MPSLEFRRQPDGVVLLGPWQPEIVVAEAILTDADPAICAYEPPLLTITVRNGAASYRLTQQPDGTFRGQLRRQRLDYLVAAS